MINITKKKNPLINKPSIIISITNAYENITHRPGHQIALLSPCATNRRLGTRTAIYLYSNIFVQQYICTAITAYILTTIYLCSKVAYS